MYFCHGKKYYIYIYTNAVEVAKSSMEMIDSCAMEVKHGDSLMARV